MFYWLYLKLYPTTVFLDFHLHRNLDTSPGILFTITLTRSLCEMYLKTLNSSDYLPEFTFTLLQIPLIFNTSPISNRYWCESTSITLVVSEYQCTFNFFFFTRSTWLNRSIPVNGRFTTSTVDQRRMTEYHLILFFLYVTPFMTICFSSVLNYQCF